MEYDAPIRVLGEVFGFNAFRPLQEEVVHSLLRGEDNFVLMPTGGGKSLCYQLPALLLSGTTIVVSPLIAIMQDQVVQLTNKGIAAACYHSGLTPQAAQEVLKRLHQGEIDLLYIAPERLLTRVFLQRLQCIKLALFAIDEAHCISRWGHDFRQEYTQLGKLRELFPSIPMVALTATADFKTRQDIQTCLGLARAKVSIASFNRCNIYYRVLPKQKPIQQLMQFLKTKDGQAGIIYCSSRKRVEAVAEQLRQAGLTAAAYHAGLTPQLRQTLQNAFLQNQLTILVATIAFGMGIDKPNCRYIVHYDLPKDLEAYYQETGRAGRDGLAAEALMLLGKRDVLQQQALLLHCSDLAQRERQQQKLNALLAYAESKACRRRYLLQYFGEALEKDCAYCDSCLNKLATAKPSQESVLQCLQQVRRQLAEQAAVPPFVIMSDAHLLAMAALEPQACLSKILAIPGISPSKIKRYGQDFLAALQYSHAKSLA